jgi:hypothetical protein
VFNAYSPRSGDLHPLLAAAGWAPDSEPSWLSYICKSQRVGELRVLSEGVSSAEREAGLELDVTVPSPELGRARGDTVADDTCDADSLRGPFGADPDAFSPLGGMRSNACAVRVDGACRVSSGQPEPCESRSSGDGVALVELERSFFGATTLLVTIKPPLRPNLTASPPSPTPAAAWPPVPLLPHSALVSNAAARILRLRRISPVSAPPPALLGDKQRAPSLRMLDADELTGEKQRASAPAAHERATAAVSPAFLRAVFPRRVLAAWRASAWAISASSSRVLSSRNALSWSRECSRLVGLLLTWCHRCSSPASSPFPGGAARCCCRMSPSTLRGITPTPWSTPAPPPRSDAEHATAPTRSNGASPCMGVAHDHGLEAVDGGRAPPSPDMDEARRPVAGRPAQRKRSSSLSQSSVYAELSEPGRSTVYGPGRYCVDRLVDCAVSPVTAATAEAA